MGLEEWENEVLVGLENGLCESTLTGGYAQTEG